MSSLLEEGCDINITLRKNAERMIVSVSFKNNQVKDEAKNLIPPFTVSGTAEELDAEFTTVIKEPVTKSKGLQTSMKEYEAAMEVAKANTKSATDAKKKESDAKKKEADAEKKKKDEYKKHLDAANKLKNEKKWKEAMKEYQAASLLASPEEKEKIAVQISICRNNDTPDMFNVFDTEEDDLPADNQEETSQSSDSSDSNVTSDEDSSTEYDDENEDDDEEDTEDPGWGESNDFE